MAFAPFTNEIYTSCRFMVSPMLHTTTTQIALVFMLSLSFSLAISDFCYDFFTRLFVHTVGVSENHICHDTCMCNVVQRWWLSWHVVCIIIVAFIQASIIWFIIFPFSLAVLSSFHSLRLICYTQCETMPTVANAQTPHSDEEKNQQLCQ